MNVTPLAKHDALATISIRFLSGLVGKLMHKQLFEGEGTLAEIFGKIVIPNLMIREVSVHVMKVSPFMHLYSIHVSQRIISPSD